MDVIAKMFTMAKCDVIRMFVWLSLIIRMLFVHYHKNLYSGLGWSHKCLLWLMVITRLFTLIEREHKNVYLGWT